MSVPKATVLTEARGRPVSTAPSRFRHFVVRHPAFVGWGLASALVLIIVAAAPLLAPHDPNLLDLSVAQEPPSSTYWFGTDEVGRDVFSRVLYGGRESIVAALAVISAAIVIGTVVGATAGWLGGHVDDSLMRLTDLFFAFPPLVLAMAVSATLGPSLQNAVIAAIVVWWPTYARLMRGEVIRVKNNLYVEASRVLGLTSLQIVRRHVLPQTWGVLNARATVDIGYTILFIATLGFVGLGSRPPASEWGTMIATARAYFLDAWWTMTFPGLALFVTVICFSLFGDAINDIIGLRGRVISEPR
jgi:peptide/nickel transport system permease protein